METESFTTNTVPTTSTAAMTSEESSSLTPENEADSPPARTAEER